MTTAFTAGPWQARKAESGSSWHIVPENDTRLVIAGTQPYPVAPHEANAHLIAAAPELYAALKDLFGDRPQVQGGICQHCGRDYIGDMLEGDCPAEDCPAHVACAAVAKAEGRALKEAA